jgi:hypothetical protein
VLTLILIAIACFVAGLAVQRHHRDDAICNAFSDTVIALVMTPINSFKAKLNSPPKPQGESANPAGSPQS